MLARRALVVAAVLTVTSAVAGAAQLRGTGAGTGTATTGTWRAAFSLSATGTPATGPLSLTVPKAGDVYFSVVNTGSLPLSTGTYSLSSTSVTLQSCSGTWSEATDACVGVVSSVPSGTSTTAVPGQPGARLRLRAVNSNTKNNVTVSVGLSLPRSSTRAGTTRSS